MSFAMILAAGPASVHAGSHNLPQRSEDSAPMREVAHQIETLAGIVAVMPLEEYWRWLRCVCVENPPVWLEREVKLAVAALEFQRELRASLPGSFFAPIESLQRSAPVSPVPQPQATGEPLKEI